MRPRASGRRPVDNIGTSYLELEIIPEISKCIERWQQDNDRFRNLCNPCTRIEWLHD